MLLGAEGEADAEAVDPVVALAVLEPLIEAGEEGDAEAGLEGEAEAGLEGEAEAAEEGDAAALFELLPLADDPRVAEALMLEVTEGAALLLMLAELEELTLALAEGEAVIVKE